MGRRRAVSVWRECFVHLAKHISAPFNRKCSEGGGERRGGGSGGRTLTLASFQLMFKAGEHASVCVHTAAALPQPAATLKDNINTGE